MIISAGCRQLGACECCRYYLHGECVESCPDGYFKSTLLPASSQTSSSDNEEMNGIASSVGGDYWDSAMIDRLIDRQCLPCHVTCASCVGQLSTDCVQCRDGLLWSHGRCLLTCDYL